ncbi:MAG: hypothetical protein ABH952_01110 [Candidatus Omnitrophota bacterium]
MDLVHVIGTVAAIILPLWNIPLIMRIKKRKSSHDVSLWWVWGVWVCFVLMLPSGLNTVDIVFKTFTVGNFILFTSVLYYVVKYR